MASPRHLVYSSCSTPVAFRKRKAWAPEESAVILEELRKQGRHDWQSVGDNGLLFSFPCHTRCRYFGWEFSESMKKILEEMKKPSSPLPFNKPLWVKYKKLGWCQGQIKSLNVDFVDGPGKDVFV